MSIASFYNPGDDAVIYPAKILTMEQTENEHRHYFKEEIIFMLQP